MCPGSSWTKYKRFKWKSKVKLSAGACEDNKDCLSEPSKLLYSILKTLITSSVWDQYSLPLKWYYF